MKSIFTDDAPSTRRPIFEKNAPIKDYSVYVAPHLDETAKINGEKCTHEVVENFIADFEKNEEYCAKHGGLPDLMCHVSTFYKLNGKIFMTYYASSSSSSEDPFKQVARLAICNENDPSDMIIKDILSAGETVENKKVDRVYDTIMAYDGKNLLYLLWTASLDGKYYRLYRTYDIYTDQMGNIGVNRLKVGDITNDFSTSGIMNALAENDIPQKEMFSDIGIMQKFSTRIENGQTYYYTGAYSGFLTFIIKSKDFITWEYVSAPDFINFSVWENATFVLNDKVFYFVRQGECNQGFLTTYDLIKKTWETPVLIADCQSRSDFFIYKDGLYLVNAPFNREGFAVSKINTDDITDVTPILFADMKSSLFYPFVRIYGDDAYLSYTVDRKHIRLTKFSLKNYI